MAIERGGRGRHTCPGKRRAIWHDAHTIRKKDSRIKLLSGHSMHPNRSSVASCVHQSNKYWCRGGQDYICSTFPKKNTGHEKCTYAVRSRFIDTFDPWVVALVNIVLCNNKLRKLCASFPRQRPGYTYIFFGGEISSVAHCAHTSLFIYIYTDYENLKFHF
jgi:hypothetical protein